MRARIIVGANYGDEGKGTVTAYYASTAKGKCLNVLTNGGAQRGHTVVTPFAEHTFKHFGSGTFFCADTYFSSYFICNPMEFYREYTELSKVFDMCKIKVYRHPDCRWTTPWDMMANQMLEIERGDKRHGSCGMGIWNTVSREGRVASISIDEFERLPIEDQFAVLENIRSSYFWVKKFKSYSLYKDAWESKETIRHFLSDIDFLFSRSKEMYPEYIFHEYEDIIFENGQGLLLSEDEKNVNTTPSDTGSTYAVNMLRSCLSYLESVDIHYVTRPYLTRHGNGILENEQPMKWLGPGIKEDYSNHNNKWQGEFRYGKLNLLELKERIAQDMARNSYQGGTPILNITRVNLDVTHNDELDISHFFKQEFENVHFFDKRSL